MTTKPMRDNVVVKVNKAETVSVGGIVLTDGASEKPNEGTVLQVGPGKTTKEGVTIPINLKVGDRVLYYNQAGQAVKINGEEVLVLKEDEIYAVLED